MAYGHPSHNWNPDKYVNPFSSMAIPQWYTIQLLSYTVAHTSTDHQLRILSLYIHYILYHASLFASSSWRASALSERSWLPLSKRVKTAFSGFHKGWLSYPALSPWRKQFLFQPHRNSRQHISTFSTRGLSSGFPNTSWHVSRLSSKVTWRQTHPQIGIQSLNLWKCCCWCCSRSPHHCCDLTANVALAHNGTALANYNAKWIQSLWLSKHLQLQMTFKIKRESIWTEILPEDILSKLLGFYMACSSEARRTDRLGHDTLAACAEPRIAASHLATHQFLTRGANMQRLLSGKAGKRFLFWFQMEF